MEPTEIAGYRVVRRLGAGGMGEVFLVDHPRLPRQDALKLLGPQFGGDAEFAARFTREADILAGLRHPNIVTIYDRGEYEGRLWLSMEFVAGEDAAQHLRTRGPLPPETVAQVIEQVGGALDWAWDERRLTHRDIKPGNILLEPPRSGRATSVKLVDFGIAKATDDSSSLTATGMAVGTMAYLAPEVIEGEPTDSRTDQYSLACTAFELLTGTPPFGPGTPSSVMMAHLQAPVPDPASRLAGLPAALAGVFRRAMAKRPEHRFADNAEFARSFRAALNPRATAPNRPPVPLAPVAQQPVSAPTVIRPTPPPTPVPPYASSASAPVAAGQGGNGRVIALAVVVAVLAVVLAMVGYLAFGRGSDSASAVPTTTVTDPGVPTGASGPTVTATVTTSALPSPTVPGTDAYGFTGSPARCSGGETLELAVLTSGAGSGSRVVICSSGGSYTYRGARASGDNSGLTLPASQVGAGSYRAINRDSKGVSANDTIYTASSGGLVITRGDGRSVASEPARSAWTR